MKNLKYLYILLAVISLSGCYSKEELTSELGKPKHEIKDSSDPIDHFIYNFYTNTGVSILYDFEELDYKWNLNSTDYSPYDVVKQSNREYLSKGMDYLNRVLFDYYDAAFAKKYFPIYILVCDSLTKSPSKANIVTVSGRNHMIISGINSNLDNLTSSDLNSLKGEINGNLWGNNIYANALMEFPQPFFAPCEEYYGYKIGTKYDDPPFDAKKLGFWDKDASNSTASTFMAPRQATDIAQFVKEITSSTREEMLAKMEGYPILYNKYIVLTNFFKEKYGIDLQAIGENRP